jgi:hypothetical protein
MALTEEQQRLREGRLTASAVGALMSGDEDKLLDLWREMTGADRDVPDWEHIWPVQLGVATEALNLSWYSYRTGRPLCRQGEVVVHPRHEWAASTLDAFDEGLVGPVDAKHVGGWEQRSVIVARYLPQMTWQMDCTCTKKSVLSIIEGVKEPVAEFIEWDADYSAELWRRAEQFMECVWNLTPPVALPAVAAPVAAVREVCMDESNIWTNYAAEWLDCRVAAKAFAAAEKELKAAVPADAKRAYGAGIECIRDRAGRLSIKGMKP